MSQNNIQSIITTEQAKEGFYPTPRALAEKLLDGIQWGSIKQVLEPSAGKGDLLDVIAEKHNDSRFGRNGNWDSTIEVDYVELDPYLRSIVQYKYGGEQEREVREKLQKYYDIERQYIPEIGKYKKLTEEEAAQKTELEIIKSRLYRTKVRLVHDDFLTFDSFKRYDLIVMNPPFANGEEHLLRAIALQSRFGGQIRCLLNAETLLNPYTLRRKTLCQKLQELNAEIVFEENGFAHAERQTDVCCAIIKLSIPEEQRESEILHRLKKAVKLDTEDSPEVTEMSVTDLFNQLIARYDVEVKAGMALIKEYNAMKPYIMDSIREKSYSYPILTLCVGTPSRTCRGDKIDTNEYVRMTRLKYWDALLSNKEFIGKLTSNLQEKYREMIQELQDYDFTLFNIQKLYTEMCAEMAKGIQDTILDLFDRLTEKHSWYPEMEKNRHYFNGWATNKVHKINKKVILPVNGLFSSYSWEKDSFSLNTAEYTISDIEKVFEYLDGNMSAPVNLHHVLEFAQKRCQTKNIACKFFDVTFYKKGTMHIVFRNQDLVDRFNIYCCQKKGWLPPNYGKATYTDMTEQERAVVDGFHADGTSGSGEKAYQQVLARKDYFLSSPTQALPLLTASNMEVA